MSLVSPLYFHLNWMKQHSVQCRLSRRLCKETCWLFHNFSLGSGNEVLSCSDHDAKLSSSRAEDSPWRGTPRRQLAWHIRPLQQLHKEGSSLCGNVAACVWLIVSKCISRGNSHLGCFLFKFGPGHLRMKKKSPCGFMLTTGHRSSETHLTPSTPATHLKWKSSAALLQSIHKHR